MQSPDEPRPSDDAPPPEGEPKGADDASDSNTPSDETAWELPSAVPSAWVGFWPHQDPPSQEEVGRAIANWIGRELDAEAGQPDPDEGMLWALMLRVPGVTSPVVIWAEHALSADSAQLPDEKMRTSKWVIGMQTVLEAGEQHAEYFHLVAMLAGALPELTGMLDVANGRRYTRAELDTQFLAADAVPNDEFVWTITAISPDESDESPMMLFTTGMARCGLPELELLEVPSKHAQTAAVLMNHVASLLLEEDPPAPGDPFEIGPDISITMVPWREYAQYMQDETPGSIAFRRVAGSQGDGTLQGVRAVVCAPERQGTFRKVWTWPSNVIHMMEEGRAVLYASEHAAMATQRRAQRTWPAFATAFASLRRSAAPDIAELAPRAFHVQAPVGGADLEDRREQGWFLVQKFDGDTVEASLVDDPVTRADVHAGDSVRILRSDITDWRVLLPDAVYGPDAGDQLLQAVDKLRGLE